MIRRAAFALTLVPVLSLACSEKSAPPAAGSPTAADNTALADEACPRIDKPFFFVVRRNGQASYLLGTRHAGVRLAKLPAFVGKQLDAARVVVVEHVDSVATKAAPPTTTAAPAAGSAEPGTATVLGPKQWATYAALVGPEVAARVRDRSPVMAMASLALLYEDAGQSIDAEILARARAAGKELVPLDTAADSADATSSLLGPDALAEALATIPSRAAIRASTALTLGEYCAGKVPPPSAGGSAVDERRRASTARRTEAWLPRLEPLLTAGGAFIAVGNAHVAEAGGLRDLLRERGYEVSYVEE